MWTEIDTVIRHEGPSDAAQVRDLNDQAFGTTTESRIVDALRDARGSISLVATTDNTSNPAAFVADDQYNTPLDIIDGYFTAGFRVVQDPGTLSDFTHTGNWNYTEATQGTATVQDEWTHYYTPGAFTSVNVNVPRRANVFFPADVAGVTNPAQISASEVPVLPPV